MSGYRIPFNRPSFVGNEQVYIAQAVASGHLSGDGRFTNKRQVFIDIRPDTLNFDEAQLERLITPRTKAIAVVHYAGVGCAMNLILDIARRYHAAVIEDNAHGLFCRYHGKYLGTFGSLATQSFHETKN